MDALILAAIPRRSRIIRSLGNSGGLLTQNALLVDVPSGWMAGNSELIVAGTRRQCQVAR